MQDTTNQPDMTSNRSMLEQAEQIAKNLSASVSQRLMSFGESVRALDEEIAQLTANTARQFGRTQREIVGLREEAAKAYPEIVRFGGQFADVATIQKEVSNILGTNTILLGETTADLFLAARAVGLAASDVDRMTLAFQNAGVSAGLIRKRIEETVAVSRAVGANVNAVFALVESNLKNVNKYGFENGAAGLAKMAATAATLRIDMDGIFGFAERVFNPEGAIRMVAAFQRLGVATGDLANPFRLAYLASEDVGELTNQVANMTSSLMRFNETTGEFEVFPTAKRDLRAIAEETGFAYEELINMAQGMRKLNMLSEKMTFAGFSEDDRKLIANMAQFSKAQGEFVVKIGREEKLISEISPEDLRILKDQPVTLEQLASASFTEEEKQTQLLEYILAALQAPGVGARVLGDVRESISAILAKGFKATEVSFGNTKEQINQVNKLYEQGGETILNLLKGEGGFGDINKFFEKAGTDLEKGINSIGEALMGTNFQEASSKYISSGNKIAEGAQLAYDGLVKLGEKAKSFVTGVEPVDAKVTIPTTNVQAKMEVSDIKYTGTVNVNVTTPQGTTNQSDINKTAYDITQTSAFQNAVKNMLEDAMRNSNFGLVPNKSV